MNRATHLSPSTVARVLMAVDITAIVSRHCSLNPKAGDHRLWGFCPFHEEEHWRSLMVTSTSAVKHGVGSFRCWGCGYRGNVIAFVQRIEHLDFDAAVVRLACEEGI